LVEGDAELLLADSLARHCDVDVVGSGITVVSTAGLNFEIFLPFVKGDALGVPVAILTDGDPPAAKLGPTNGGKSTEITVDARGSAYGRNLEAKVRGDGLLRVFRSDVTLEYDLALPPGNHDAIIDALRNTVGPIVFDRITSLLKSGIDWPQTFYQETFKARKTSKAIFAQELALQIDGLPPGSFTVPTYIRDAFIYLKPPMPPNK
jgi:predicted ATP-dependent endonuclease of OLD family